MSYNPVGYYANVSEIQQRMHSRELNGGSQDIWTILHTAYDQIAENGPLTSEQISGIYSVRVDCGKCEAYSWPQTLVSSRLKVTKLQDYLRDVCGREQAARHRNQKLLQDCDRVDAHATALAVRTDTLRRMKLEYEKQVEQLYPSWKEQLEKKRQEDLQCAGTKQDNANDSTPSFSRLHHPAEGFIDHHGLGNRTDIIRLSVPTYQRHTLPGMSLGLGHHLPAAASTPNIGRQLHFPDDGPFLDGGIVNDEASFGPNYQRRYAMRPESQERSSSELSDVNGSRPLERSQGNSGHTMQTAVKAAVDPALQNVDSRSPETDGDSSEEGASRMENGSQDWFGKEQPTQVEFLTSVSDSGALRKGHLKQPSEMGSSSGAQRHVTYQLDSRPDQTSTPKTARTTSFEAQAFTLRLPVEGVVIQHGDLSTSDTFPVENFNADHPLSADKHAADERSDQDENVFASEKSELTVSGLFYLLQTIEQTLGYSEEAGSSQLYISTAVRPADLAQVIRFSNSGGGSLEEERPELSMLGAVVLQQLQRLSQETTDGCLLPEGLLTADLTPVTADTLRAHLQVDSGLLWERWYKHALLLIHHGALSSSDIATLFGPLLVSETCEHLPQAVELLKNILEGEEAVSPDRSLSRAASDDSGSLSKSDRLSQAQLVTTLESQAYLLMRQCILKQDSLDDNAPSLDLKESGAEKLSSNDGAQAESDDDDDDDDIEALLSPGRQKSVQSRDLEGAVQLSPGASGSRSSPVKSSDEGRSKTPSPKPLTVNMEHSPPNEATGTTPPRGPRESQTTAASGFNKKAFWGDSDDSISDADVILSPRGQEARADDFDDFYD